jgi:hypothetical protein
MLLSDYVKKEAIKLPGNILGLRELWNKLMFTNLPMIVFCDHKHHQIGHENAKDDPICFCKNVRYSQHDCFHITDMPCHETEYMWCVRATDDGIKVIQLRQFSCELTKYTFEGNK